MKKRRSRRVTEVEGWTQGFRLGKKMLLKFEREEEGAEATASGEFRREEQAARKRPLTKDNRN